VKDIVCIGSKIGVKTVPICLTLHHKNIRLNLGPLYVFQGSKARSQAIAITKTYDDKQKEN